MTKKFEISRNPPPLMPYTHFSASSERFWQNPDGVIVQAINNQRRRDTTFSRRFLVSTLSENDAQVLNQLYEQNLHNLYQGSVDLRSRITLLVDNYSLR